MTYGELPVHECFSFGQARYIPVRWEKLDAIGRCVKLSLIGAPTFDDPRRATGKTDLEKKRGVNFFPESHLYSWLNDASTFWTHPFEDNDFLSDFYGEKGFLNLLGLGEYLALQPWEMPVRKTSLYKQYPDTMNVMVGLPTNADMRSVKHSFVMNAKGLCVNEVHTHSCGRWDFDLQSSVAVSPRSSNTGVVPVVCIKPDTPMLWHNEWNMWYIDSDSLMHRAIAGDLNSLMA